MAPVSYGLLKILSGLPRVAAPGWLCASSWPPIAKHVEGAELHFAVVPAEMQHVEVGVSIDAKVDGLAVETN
jgi:hypothetical protein